MTDYNPIKSVDGYSVKAPSSYQWDMEDLSDSSAGRTEDCLMHKNRIGQKVAVSLSWNNVDTAVASSILKRFNPEYIEVNYLDPKEGGYVTKTFYVGNRSAPLYNGKLGLWSNISFKIIEK